MIRETIARAIAEPITGFEIDHLLASQTADLFKVADAVIAGLNNAGYVIAGANSVDTSPPRSILPSK